MKEQLTTELIETCKKSVWNFGNGVLYKLCAENFYHTKDEHILAKVWLIGRAYAAAIERRRIKEAINDDFYIDKVVPTFKNSSAVKPPKRLASKALGTVPKGRLGVISLSVPTFTPNQIS